MRSQRVTVPSALLWLAVLTQASPIIKQNPDRELTLEHGPQNHNPSGHDGTCILPHLMPKPGYRSPHDLLDMVDFDLSQDDLDEIMALSPDRCSTLVCKVMAFLKALDEKPQIDMRASQNPSDLPPPRKYEMKMFAKALRLAKEIQDPKLANFGTKPNNRAIPNGSYFYSPSSRTWEKIRI